MNGHLAFCLAVRINLSIDTIIIVFYNEPQTQTEGPLITPFLFSEGHTSA